MGVPVTFSQVVWLIGCWLVSASYKLRKKEENLGQLQAQKEGGNSSVLLRKEIINKLVVDLLQQIGPGCLGVLKTRCNQKG